MGVNDCGWNCHTEFGKSVNFWQDDSPVFPKQCFSKLKLA